MPDRVRTWAAPQGAPEPPAGASPARHPAHEGQPAAPAAAALGGAAGRPADRLAGPAASPPLAPQPGVLDLPLPPVRAPAAGGAAPGAGAPSALPAPLAGDRPMALPPGHPRQHVSIRTFGMARTVHGGDVVTTWRPPLRFSGPFIAQAIQLEQQVVSLFGGVEANVAGQAPGPAAHHEAGHLITVSMNSWLGPSPWDRETAAAGPPAAPAADLSPVALALSVETFEQEARRRMQRRADAHPRTLHALRRLVAEVRRRPAAPPSQDEGSPLRADDLDGFDARATYRLPAMLFARQLAAIWQTGASGLELLDGAHGAPGAMVAALQRALDAEGGPADHRAVCRLAAQAEAVLDGGRLDDGQAASTLASAMLLSAHQLPPDLLSELLRRTVVGEEGGRPP